jgi:hypothetical protein
METGNQVENLLLFLREAQTLAFSLADKAP